MTAIELHRQWEILLDKYESPYFTDEEFNSIANKSQLEVVTDIFYDRFEKMSNPYRKDAHLGEPKYGWENTQLEGYDLAPITKNVSLTAAANGQIQYTDINTAISGTLYHLGQVGVSYDGVNFVKGRWVRHNDYEAFEENYYKKSSQNRPFVRMYDEYIQVEPAAAVNTRMTVLRYPTDILYDANNPANNVDPELSDRVINMVIHRMAKNAGIGIRDRELYQTVKDLEQNS